MVCHEVRFVGGQTDRQHCVCVCMLLFKVLSGPYSVSLTINCQCHPCIADGLALGIVYFEKIFLSFDMQ